MAINENKVEKVGIDNIDYEDVAQFEAFENFRKDPDNDNIEEDPRCALNYIDLKDTSENRMFNDKIVSAVQKNAEEAIRRSKWVTRSCTRARIEVYRSIPFVQARHDGRMYWVAISTYDRNQGQIYLMNSLFNG